MFIYRIEHKITGFGPYCSTTNHDTVGNVLRKRHNICWGEDAAGRQELKIFLI